ncbi:Protein kinase domain-containing protein [Entamoeba marina]
MNKYVFVRLMDGYYASTLPFYSTTNSQLFLFDFERIKSLISKKHKKIAKTTNHESVEKRETNKKSCVAKLIGKERTVDEIKSIQKFGSLHHKNLTSIYAYQITPPIVYMEYCERWSLLDVMKTNSELLNSEVTWCKIAIGILKGLKYLHSNCYLHLNLHPSNVLLTSNLTVKLTDPSFSPFSTIYPIYKTMKNLNQNTFSKNIQYYPKEVFTNKPTHHSDIYIFSYEKNIK